MIRVTVEDETSEGVKQSLRKLAGEPTQDERSGDQQKELERWKQHARWLEGVHAEYRRHNSKRIAVKEAIEGLDGGLAKDTPAALTRLLSCHERGDAEGAVEVAQAIMDNLGYWVRQAKEKR